ncbi:MAG: cytochrome c [Acidobacteria bacterium]|nr:cytochrome c [Acidobacteriota bacterium]
MTSMTIPASDAIFEAASEPPTTDEKWGALRKAAETLQTKNADALAPASDDVYTTCENCHTRYLEEPAKEPEPPR